MAIENKRIQINEDASEARLKNKLKEDFNRFLNEDDDEVAPEEDVPAEDDLENMDLEDGLGDDDGLESGLEPGQEQGNPLDALTDPEAERVDQWIDELLSDSLDAIPVDDSLDLDTETPAADLDPLGTDQFVHEDLPMTAQDLESIIDSDDSLSALEQELADLAVEQETGEGEEENIDIDTDDDFGFNDEPEAPLEEAADPMSGVDEYFTKGFNGVDTKDELATAHGKIGDAKNPQKVDFKVTSKVAATPGARSFEDIQKDQKGVVTEAKKMKQMLINAANVIAKQQNDIAKKNKIVESLKLENLRLVKANGLLSVAGDILSKDARTKISEGFDRCATVDQVNKYYGKLTENIKNIARPSLNDTVLGRKTRVSVLKESQEPSNEKITNDQMRINMLMGLSNSEEGYYQ